MKISYRIGLGQSRLEPGAGSHLLDLEVRAALQVPTNLCRIELDGLADLALKAGDPVTVDLGSAGATSRVFTGTAALVERGIRTVQIEALGGFDALAGAYLNLLYEGQAAGEIVSDVLKRLGLRTAKVESGITLDSYALSDRQSAWEHLRGLALRCGFVFYADAQDRAVFQKPAPASTHTFGYGASLLEFVHDPRPALVAGVEVYGESPVGQGQGQEASSWLTKRAVTGRAGGSGPRVLRRFDGALRSQRLAGQVAQNILGALQVRSRGRARVPGAPAVALGDALAVQDLPAKDQNGTFRVTGLLHRLNRRHGFVTEIAWEG